MDIRTPAQRPIQILASTATTMDKATVHQAIRDDKFLLAKELIREHPKLVNEQDEDGRLPLHWAVSGGDVYMVAFLAANMTQAEIDDMVDNSGWTPVHIAAAIGRSDILDVLLTHDPVPDIDLATGSGTTALHLAVSKNHYDVVKQLIQKYHCSTRTKDKLGRTAMHRAAAIGSQPIVRTLVDARANINAKDSDGWTPMHHALAEGHGDVAKLLRECGGDPEIRNNDGQLPVQVAVDDNVRKYFSE